MAIDLLKRRAKQENQKSYQLTLIAQPKNSGDSNLVISSTIAAFAIPTFSDLFAANFHK